MAIRLLDTETGYWAEVDYRPEHDGLPFSEFAARSLEPAWKVLMADIAAESPYDPTPKVIYDSNKAPQ